VVLILGTLVAMLLAAGGVYYLLGDVGGGNPTGASAQGDAPGKEEAAGAAGGNSGGAQDEDPPKAPGQKNGGKNIVGQWRSGSGVTLTVGKAAQSGKADGKSAVAYNRLGRLSTCRGVGEPRKADTYFRLALKCANGASKSDLGGNAVRSGTKLTIEWDGGSRETLTRVRN
jgi:hypothetical protein